jgi:hypothetical protein
VGSDTTDGQRFIHLGNSLARQTTTRWPFLAYGTAGDAEAREEEYIAGSPYTGPLTVIKD